MRLVLDRAARQASGDDDGEEIASPSSLRVWRIAHGFRFRLGDAALQVDERTGAANGALPDDFWTWPMLRQRGLLLVVLLTQLAAWQRYGVHANAVDGDHGGVLIVGDSGSGKTTLTICLVSQGWRYVADDAIVAHRTADGGVEALAVRRSLSSDPRTVRHVPELRAQVRSEALQEDGKYLIELDAVYPGRAVTRCRPRLILFPEIGDGVRSDLEAMSDTDAMLRLLGQASVGTVCPDRAADQLGTLRQLVQQARCVRVRLGSDVLADRAAVAARLERAMRGCLASSPAPRPRSGRIGGDSWGERA